MLVWHFNMLLVFSWMWTDYEAPLTQLWVHVFACWVKGMHRHIGQYKKYWTLHAELKKRNPLLYLLICLVIKNYVFYCFFFGFFLQWKHYNISYFLHCCYKKEHKTNLAHALLNSGMQPVIKTSTYRYIQHYQTLTWVDILNGCTLCDPFASHKHSSLFGEGQHTKDGPEPEAYKAYSVS